MIGRIELAQHFDCIIQNVKMTREREVGPITYWLAKHEMALIEIKRLSILGAASFDPCLDPSVTDLACSSGKNAVVDIVYRRIYRVLSAYSPKDVNPSKAARILIHLLEKVKIGNDPNKACEAVSLRYCGVFDIDACGSDAVYLEVVIREAIGLYGDVPASPVEQIDSIKIATKVFKSVNENTGRTLGVSKSSTNERFHVV